MKTGDTVKDIHGILYKVIKVFPDGHFDIQHIDQVTTAIPWIRPTLYSECMREYKIVNEATESEVQSCECSNYRLEPDNGNTVKVCNNCGRIF